MLPTEIVEKLESYFAPWDAHAPWDGSHIPNEFMCVFAKYTGSKHYEMMLEPQFKYLPDVEDDEYLANFHFNMNTGPIAIGVSGIKLITAGDESPNWFKKATARMKSKTRWLTLKEWENADPASYESFVCFNMEEMWSSFPITLLKYPQSLVFVFVSYRFKPFYVTASKKQTCIDFDLV
jgi:hypothetical protein